MDEDGTFLIPDTNRGMVFKCVGIRNPIWPMVVRNHGGKFPLMTATMIPWYGRLVYDGVLLPPDGLPVPPVAAPHLECRLKASLQQAKNQGRVIERLAQLEVEGGSLVGLHDLIAASKSKEKKTQEPPTLAEQTLVDKIKKIPKMPEPDFNQTENVDGMWVMRRMGYTEIENPEHRVVVLNSGAPLGFFSCSNLVPTSQEILKAVLKTAKLQGKRPVLVEVDDSETADRVEFLLKDVEGTRGYYYPPPTAEETAALSLRMG